MSTDTTTLAGQILRALDTSSQLPALMDKILDEAKSSSHFEQYVQQIISQIQVYPGAAFDDNRERAVALLQQLLEYPD